MVHPYRAYFPHCHSYYLSSKLNCLFLNYPNVLCLLFIFIVSPTPVHPALGLHWDVLWPDECWQEQWCMVLRPSMSHSSTGPLKSFCSLLLKEIPQVMDALEDCIPERETRRVSSWTWPTAKRKLPQVACRFMSEKYMLIVVSHWDFGFPLFHFY